MAAQHGEDVYVTLLLSDTYLPGALVLAHSLRDAGTTKKLAVLVTLDTVSAEVVTQLKTVFDHVIPVPRVRNDKPANLYLMDRADLHSAFTKINLWKQTQFRKIVYIDADIVAYRAPDELFDLTHPFSAAPDIGWPDLFNSGVMVLSPNLGDYYALKAMAERGISFDGADQGLLNMHFKNNYNRLSFTYNVTPSGHYQYVPAYKHFQSSISMVHFIGSAKPWAQGRQASSGGASPCDEMVGRWWAVYDRHYRQPSPLLAPADGAKNKNLRKVPEIVQYFVKGEYRPATVTYVVPTGEPPLNQGRSIHDAYYQAPQPSQPDYHHNDHHHHHQQTHEHHRNEQPIPNHDEKSQPGDSIPHPHIPHSAPSESLSSIVQGEKAEAREGQVSGPQGAHIARNEEREHKHEQRPTGQSWDAQRQAPPADSKPEAANFPQMHYEMSSDPAPFVPPQRYPSPPKNMWYEVPKQKPASRAEKPRPIFPWETGQTRPSRVFADDAYPSEPSLTEGSTVAPSGTRTSSLESQATMLTEPSMTESSSTEHKTEPSTPTTPAIRVTASDPWASFTRVNAWDDDPAIDKYVGSIPLYRRHKSSGSIVGEGSPRGAGGSGAGSQQETSAGAEWRRRGSKLTDFPTAIERPSLPVTPAPIRRPKFWGAGGPGIDDDGEDDSQLPAADGVPQQSEWDPVARLQLLAKQQSELLLQKLGAGEVSGGSEAGGAAGSEGHSIPNRPLPFGSEDLVSSKYNVRSSNVLSPQPVKPLGAGPRGILGEVQDENEAKPRSTSATSTETTKPAKPGSTIPEPAYHGPGATWEKDEGYLGHSTAMPPSEEEKDVLQT